MVTYWVVEPHADDAFLSLHEHMLRWIATKDVYVHILTVYSQPKRDEEGNNYAKAIGAHYTSLTLEDQSHLGMPPKPILPRGLWNVNYQDGDQWIFPLGLQHPDHKQVRAQAPEDSWFYLDLPGQAKLKVGKELLRRVRGRRIVSMLYAPKWKWKHIRWFKSQAKFFYFNRVESLARIPEVIVR